LASRSPASRSDVIARGAAFYSSDGSIVIDCPPGIGETAYNRVWVSEATNRLVD
jgi:hypothetical protein